MSVICGFRPEKVQVLRYNMSVLSKGKFIGFSQKRELFRLLTVPRQCPTATERTATPNFPQVPRLHSSQKCVQPRVGAEGLCLCVP